MSRSSCTRRIVISTHCFVQIDLDPLHPHLIPKIKFLGSDKLTHPLMESLNRFILRIRRKSVKVSPITFFSRQAQKWDSASSIASNLERCLDVSLPPRPSVADCASELQINSCGICYGLKREKKNRFSCQFLFWYRVPKR